MIQICQTAIVNLIEIYDWFCISELKTEQTIEPTTEQNIAILGTVLKGLLRVVL